MMLKKSFREGGYATTRIFLNPCPQFRMITRDESSFQKLEEVQSIHEEDPQEENLEISSSYLCEKVNESWITCNEDQTLEPEIEEFLACITQDPLCIHDFEQLPQEELCDMTIKENKTDKDHFKIWFQLVIRLQHHSPFQHSLALNLYDQLIFHVQAFIKIYFSNLDVSLLMILLRKWMHWKFSYT